MIQAPECGSNRPDNANDCRRNAANGNEGRNTNGRLMLTVREQAIWGFQWYAQSAMLTGQINALRQDHRSLNRAGGSGTGFRAQLLLFLDDLIPSVFGKPLISTQPHRSQIAW